jgi:tetratricopeptide (TPR) repeat protein
MLPTMRQLVPLAIAIHLSAAWAASADQTDPMLDTLFEQLESTGSEARAADLTADIWQRWLDAGDRTINEKLKLGVVAMNAGLWSTARSAFDEVIEMAPRFAEGWNKRATLNYISGEYDASIADCARVLALEPRHFGALSGMGLIHMAIQEDAEAIHWFERALTVNPHMPVAKENLSILREKMRGKAI